MSLDTEKIWLLSERLANHTDRALLRAAADEIERLRAAVDIARTGLLKVERQAEEARVTISRAGILLRGS